MMNVHLISWEEEKIREEELYKKFVDLRCNGTCSIQEIYGELGIRYNSSTGKRFRKRFRKEKRIPRNREYNLNKEDRYIYEHSEGGYVVNKSFNYKNVYYGRYKKLEYARKVRDKLIECDWDKNRLHDIVEEVKKEEGVKLI